MHNLTTLKRLLGYLKPYRATLIFVLIFAALSAGFMVVAPFLIGSVTTTLFESLATGTFLWEKLGWILITLVALYLASSLFSLLQGFGMSKITARAIQTLRGEVCEKMHRLKVDYYDTKSHGDILSIITNDIDTINNTLNQNVAEVVTQITTAAGVLIMMLSISPKLTLIGLAVVPLSLLAATGVLVKSEKYYNDQQNLLGQLNGYIEEVYNGQSVIQSFNYQKRAHSKFSSLNEQLKESSRKAEITSGYVTPITDTVGDLGYALAAGIGCTMAINGSITIGNVQAMLEYTWRFADPFSTIASMIGRFGATAAAVKRVFELLDTPEESAEKNATASLNTCHGAVDFSHVAFGYSADKPLMRDITLHIKPGQKVAIVGPTGAGKTTLINLLLRFYELNGGHISIDGVPITNMTRQELRRHFGMVLQDTWLFEGSIADNIAYANENLSREEIVAAAKAACAHDFIKTLPGGYDMVLSKGAENISQGERQLITIARAMAAQPEIMILDEATSNVDTYTEVLIQKALAKLMEGRTSFVIAHRLSTILDADVILYMEHGDIQEVGTHEELLGKNGKYAQLYRSQFL